MAGFLGSVTGKLVRENFGPGDQFSMEFWSGGPIFSLNFGQGDQFSIRNFGPP